MKRSLFTRSALLLFAGALVLPGVSGAAEKKNEPAYPARGMNMRIDGTLQFRYTYEEQGDKADAVSKFGWKRARLNFSGDLTDIFFYRLGLQGDNLPVNAASNKLEGSFALNTSFLGAHVPYVGDITVGRYDSETTPRSSSGRQAFAERPFHIEENRLGSQLGMVWSQDWLENRIAATAGIWNGNGDHNDDFGNDNEKHAIGGRIYLSPMAKFPFSTESDLRNSPFGIGLVAGGYLDNRGASDSKRLTNFTVKDTKGNNRTVYGETTEDSRADVRTYGAAIMARAKGAFVLADYTKRKTESKATPVVTRYDFTAKGWSAQASYAIPIKKYFLEPKIRYERYERSDATAGDDEKDFAWTTVGVNLWLSGYDTSLQFDYYFKKEKGDVEEIDNNGFVLQANMVF